ncbi:MAG: GGDEF domain-containing protein [Burkholderiales bacterium]|nr:GGDEF domain-containing protein [Burkholderiales bacterium]
MPDAPDAAGPAIDRPGAPPERGPRWLHKLGDLVLSTDRRQRLRIARAMTSMLVYAVCIGFTEYVSQQGMVDPRPVRPLQIALATWVVFIYAWLRSGLNQRSRDPALTLPQIFGAITLIAAAYSICGPLRGALMMLLALTLVFGIFNLDAAGRRASYLYAVALMAVVMSIMAVSSPEDYPAGIELAHFILVATTLPVISVLGDQLSAMRHRLKSQKAELEDAFMRIQEMAIRDELTGLYNRRYMLEVIAQQIQRLERSGASFSLVILDLDHFKRINDTLGHAVGDQVLRHFAQVARKNLRQTDVIARWGGEEFLVLLPDTPGDQGIQGVQRMRASLEEGPLVQKPEVKVTFSAGLTEFQPGETLEQAIERADQALYQAKARGRNCTKVA